MNQELQNLIDAWLKVDRDPKTRKELNDMLEAGKHDELRFILNPANRMQFGTSGLRDKMGPGYTQMNQVTLIQTVYGFCSYCKSSFADSLHKGIWVSYDARFYSDVFARITAGIFIANGIKVYFFKGLSSTPYASYFTERLGCLAGVIVTASHNPQEYNGYKIYGMNMGIQIVQPHPRNIQAEIMKNLDIKEESYRYDDYLTEEYKQKGLFIELSENSPQLNLYYDNLKELCFHPEDNQKLSINVQYSAMFGVGWPLFQRASRDVWQFDQTKIRPMQPSCTPDPRFGGEKRPNPEEHHNMHNLIKQALPSTYLIVVNDPDADRTACAERQPDGKFYIFHGNEIGLFLAEYMLENSKGIENLAICCSTVSTQILAKMARHYGASYKETLTGCKWLGHQSRWFKEEGKNCVFGFEESIGYCIGTRGGLIVQDKDGISTGCTIIEMANQLQKQGLTIYQYVQTLYQRYGYYCWNNNGFTMERMSDVPILFEKLVLRGDGKFVSEDMGRNYVWRFGKFEATRIRDMREPGYDSQEGRPKLPVDKTEMVTIYCDTVCCTIRPSGTEPKVKYYIEACSAEGREDAARIAREFCAEFLAVLGVPVPPAEE